MFDGVAFEPGITGCTVLVGAAASFDCWLRQSYRAGDHLIVLGRSSRWYTVPTWSH
jgi:flavin reductase (DIM6/NTAB) family NADH-FMN oxidoreductase RutF